MAVEQLTQTQTQTGIRALWANRPGEVMTGQLVPCLPSSVASNACALTRHEVDFLMTDLSPLYAKILDGLSRVAAIAIEADREACRVILRESVVLVTYALMDRIIRLNKVIAQEGAAGLGVAIHNIGTLPKTNVQLIGLVDGSQEFNQYLLFRLASSIWQVAAVKVERSPLSDVRNATPINNLNFDHPSLFTRIKRKISRVVSARFGRVPALRLANIEAALLDKGLYGIGKLMWLHPLPTKYVSYRNLSLREQLLPQLSEEVGATLRDELFLQQVGLDEYEAERAAKLFCELLLELIPPDRLEGIPRYLACEQHLKVLSAPALFFCGMPNIEEIHWIAAARKLRIPVVGVQHGAHYGFSMQPCHIELEYAYCDKFITWGWSMLAKHRLCNGIELISLPSPWLTERKMKWAAVDGLKVERRMLRSHDVLWMTDRLYSFPPTLSTLRVSRLDYLDSINRCMTEVVERLAKNGVRILHKPFNYTSADVQSELLASFQRSYPQNYETFPHLDKGLTAELLMSCWLVLWDEPGTGFFECLVAGIPTMLLWDRLISHEEAYARDIFISLENAGVVHRTPESLAAEVDSFLTRPSNWLNDKNRLRIIARAVERFSSVNEKWDRCWKEALELMTTA